MSDELLLESEEKNGILLIRFNGDITKTSGEKILRFYNWETSLPEGITTIVLDFTNAKYINSAGLAYLIRLARIINRQNIPIRAFGLAYHYEKIFSIVGLTNYIKHYPSEWAAVEA